MTSLKAVIIEILRARGFEITEQDGYILAKNGNNRAAFYVTRRVEQNNIDNFLSYFSNFSGKKILATTDTKSPSLLNDLRPIILWDRQDMERELDLMSGEWKGPGLVDELLTTDYPHLLSGVDVEILHDRSIGERIICPIVTAEEVLCMVSDSITAFRQYLQLVPHYVFRYACPLYCEDDRIGIESGALSVNGLTRKVEPWLENRETIYSIEEEHELLETVVTSEDAAKVAKRELIRINTFDRDSVIRERHVILTEKVRIAPREEDIELQFQGIFFIPLWRIEGIHGTISVDASTGKMVSEDHGIF
ncbi:MAG: hypothetical protein GX369_00230 [Euryarchaeota archaeon]|nr:hypothetical protein [Euryarchaeota archaeon]